MGLLLATARLHTGLQVQRTVWSCFLRSRMEVAAAVESSGKGVAVAAAAAAVGADEVVAVEGGVEAAGVGTATTTKRLRTVATTVTCSTC